MAIVDKPLFSLAASGDLAKSIQFICGHFLRQKPDSPDPQSAKQIKQRTKFTDGADMWSNTLSQDTKKNWGSIKKRISGDDWCLKSLFGISGYNIWMLYWLKFGENGWKNYPNPPIS